MYPKLKDIPCHAKHIPDLQESQLSKEKYCHQVILILNQNELFQMIEKAKKLVKRMNL